MALADSSTGSNLPKRYASSQELRKFVAPEFIFGVGALALAGQHARSLGDHHGPILGCVYL